MIKTSLSIIILKKPIYRQVPYFAQAYPPIIDNAPTPFSLYEIRANYSLKIVQSTEKLEHK